MEEKKDCICPRKDCPRYGRCDECCAHHAANKKHPPYCERQKQKAEKSKERALRRARR